MPNTRGIKFGKDEEGSLPDIEIKKEKPEEKEGERPKEEKKQEKVPSEKESEKDVLTRPDEPERAQPSTSRRVTPECVGEPKGKPAVVYGKPAPYKDIPFKVRYGKSTDEDTTENVYHSEESVPSEYSLTKEEVRKMVKDLTPECKVKYFQYKAKFEQQQQEKGYFIPLRTC